MGKTDRLLIRKIARGDRSAAEALIRRHEAGVYSLAFRVLGGDEQEARDAAQEAFLRAFAGLASLGGEQNFGGWVRTIVTHVALDRLRRAQRVRSIDPIDLGDVEHPDQPQPSEASEAAEREALLQSALRDLSPMQRAVLALRYQEDLSYREIGVTLHVTEELARYHALRARRILRTRLARPLDEVNSNEM